jgi:endonuclease YncB( thermonuclease family)
MPRRLIARIHWVKHRFHSKLGTLLATLLLVFSGLVHAGVLVGQVIGVSDGDTITLLDTDNNPQKIRLSGIDAPEKAQTYGEASKQSLSDLILHKQVHVVWEKTDRYQRILGKISLEGQDIGLEQVKRGMAWHYKQYQRDQSQEDRMRYSVAETDARAHWIGLWADDSPVEPSTFRHPK